MVFEALLEMSKTLMGRRESACSLPERRRPIGRDGVGLTEGLAAVLFGWRAGRREEGHKDPHVGPLYLLYTFSRKSEIYLRSRSF